MLNIYNTETRSKTEFKPIKKNKVSFYVCGITPQSSPHIGHILSTIRFNVIRQYLIFSGYKTTFVQNVTDVSDKIVVKSLETGIAPMEIAKKYTKEYDDTLKVLGIPPADFTPHVSQYIQEIIKYVEKLIEKGYAYVTDQGNVYFDISKKTDYGKLSKRKTEDLQNNVDEDKADDKKSPADFALWKSETMEGIKWYSPWGEGRPGWHIECSVMANTILGDRIDLHGGGIDLIFPHHENEICQCEAHNEYKEGEGFVSHWVHSGIMTVGGVKMSKSLGNFVTAEDGLNKYGPEFLKFVLLKTQYRSPINLDDSIFIENLNNIGDIYRVLQRAEQAGVGLFSKRAKDEVLETKFIEAMDNDFNTPGAIVSIMDGAKRLDEAIKNKDKKEIKNIYCSIRRLGKVLFLFQEKEIIPQLVSFLGAVKNVPELTVESIEGKLNEMEKARNDKKYDKSDKIRDELTALGITVMQGDGGVDWKFKTYLG